MNVADPLAAPGPVQALQMAAPRMPPPPMAAPPSPTPSDSASSAVSPAIRDPSEGEP